MDANFSREEKLFVLLAASFAVLLVVSNIIAGKIIIVGGMVAPAAVLCYSLTFAFTDTIAELWGREKTKFVVNIGFVATILSALFIRLAIAAPAAPFWEEQEVFAQILGSNLRIVLASLTAYLISQHHDIWAFAFWKKKTGGRHLWLRNNLSTGVSQLLDTVVFICLAFYGTGVPLLNMIAGQYALKLLIALLDTPLVYFLVFASKRIMQTIPQAVITAAENQ